MTDASPLCNVGISYPLATEIGRQMTTGVGNATLLSAVGLNAGPAIELARQINVQTFSARHLTAAMWNPTVARAIVALAMPSWLISPNNPPEADIDFLNNRAWLKAGGSFTAAGALTVTNASGGYVNDSSGNWTLVGANLPRLSSLGLLVEESRVNSIRNNSMQGAVVGVVGSGGAWPTNWGPGGGSFAGLTQTINSITTENGVDVIEVRVNGTTNTASVGLFLEGSAVITALAAQTWNQSAFFQIIAGSLTNVTALQFGILAVGGTSPANVNFSPATNFTRFGGAFVTNTSTTSIRPEIVFVVNNASAVDLTFRIGWPQLELGASVTSPIRTTSVAVTRSADNVKMTSPPTFGATYSAFAKGTPQAPTAYGSAQDILSLFNTNAGNELAMRRNAGSGIVFFQLTGGTGQVLAAAGSPVWGPSVSNRWAVAIAAGDQAESYDGGTINASSAAVLPSTPVTVSIGSEIGVNLFWNGFVERIALWTSRLPNAELQTLTT